MYLSVRHCPAPRAVPAAHSVSAAASCGTRCAPHVPCCCRRCRARRGFWDAPARYTSVISPHMQHVHVVEQIQDMAVTLTLDSNTHAMRSKAPFWRRLLPCLTSARPNRNYALSLDDQRSQLGM